MVAISKLSCNGIGAPLFTHRNRCTTNLFCRIGDESGSRLIGKALGTVGEVGLGGFKITLREQDPNWQQNRKAYGDEFFAQVRQGKDSRIRYRTPTASPRQSHSCAAMWRFS
jgi:hypothetical protein